jgi:hypothetical protein
MGCKPSKKTKIDLKYQDTLLELLEKHDIEYIMLVLIPNIDELFLFCKVIKEYVENFASEKTYSKYYALRSEIRYSDLKKARKKNN